MLSPWIIRTLTLPPLLASLIPCTFRRYHTPTIYLPQNSHHTYLLWHFHSHSEIYCHATFHHSVYYDTLHHCHIALHDHVVDIVFVAKPPFIILSYMSLLVHCLSRYTTGGIHIESYFVLVSSCNCWVVRKIKVWWLSLLEHCPKWGINKKGHKKRRPKKRERP